jgi:energy-coupling factor transport system substrate-specific component
MGRRKIAAMFVLAIMVFCLIFFRSIIMEHVYLVSFFLLLLTFMPFVLHFENRKVEGREMVLLAILAAIAAVSRIPFAAIPNVQPTTFVVIMSGYVFGAESGFLVGATAALVSNLFLGQGPWTPWQMMAWGLIGLLAGWLKDYGLLKTRFALCFYGLASGYLFGFLMNLWLILSMIHTFNLKQMAVLYSASLYFDTAHALFNVFLLYFFSTGWIKTLGRFKKKYGLLEH